MNTPIRGGAPSTTLLLLLLAATALCGCHPAKLGQGRPRDDRPMTVNARLDCPDRQGDLTRTDQAADGRTCRYTGDDGEEVTLGFLALNGKSAADALAPTEATLRTLVPAAVSGSPENAAAQTAAKAKDKSDDDSDDDDRVNTTANVTTNTEWNSDSSDSKPAGRRDHVAVNLPGVHLEAGDNGAHVHAFGQDIDANDAGGATVHAGWNGATSEIHANDGGVELRSGWTGAHALEQSYLLASDTAGPDGVQAAGYIVRGPVGGPLVLAVVKARSGGDDHDDDRFEDVKRLVRRNTHVQ